MSDAAEKGERSKRAWSVEFVNQYFVPDCAATAQMLGDLAQATARVASCRVWASRRSYDDPTVRYPSRESWRGVQVERVPATALGRSSVVSRTVDYASFLCSLCVRLAVTRPADVVAALSTPPILGALAIVRAGFSGARSVYWAMDVYPDVAFSLGAMKPSSIVGRLSRRLAEWTAVRADLVVALGDTMAERLKGQGARNVLAVHNWADGEAIRPMPAASSVYRLRAGWNGCFVVHYSGNMGLAHEFDTLLEAAGELKDDPGLRFAFLGGGPRRREIQRAVGDRNLDSVEVLPAVERSQLADSLAAGDLHVVTLRPGMPGLLVPSKIYGILAAGRPVLYIGPLEGEVHDIVTQWRCGTCVENGDVGGVVMAIRRYRQDDRAREEAGRRAREIFDREFTMEAQTAKLVEALAAQATRSQTTVSPAGPSKHARC